MHSIDAGSPINLDFNKLLVKKVKGMYTLIPFIQFGSLMSMNVRCHVDRGTRDRVCGPTNNLA